MINATQRMQIIQIRLRGVKQGTGDDVPAKDGYNAELGNERWWAMCGGACG